MLRDCSFEKSVECCEQNKFDFALLGMNADSYGEILGYYALYLTIASRNYSVVLMHDIKRPTIDTIEDIIVYALNNGYTFKTLSSDSPTVHHHVNN